MTCKYCGKNKRNESDEKLIATGFKISFCGCTSEVVKAAKDAAEYSQLLAGLDLALQNRPNDKELAERASRVHRLWEEASAKAKGAGV